jgi:hypothetical protein
MKRKNIVLSIGVLLATQAAIACASSRLETSPEHPASPQASIAPSPPINEATSQIDQPSAAGPSTPSEGATNGSHSHDGAPEAAELPSAPPAGEMSHQHHPAAQSSALAASQHANHAGAASAESDQAAQQWTCPMHPEVVQSEPGKCPKCGMKLVPKVEPPKP